MLSRTALCIHHKALLGTNAVSQRIMYRSMHITCRIQTANIRSHSVLKLSRCSPVLGSCTKRYASTVEATETNATPVASTNEIVGGNISESLTSKVLETIPDAPLPPAPTVLETVSYVGEPTFQSLGLGGRWPSGMVQQGLEALHISCNLPWWECIAIGTLIVRCIVFPLVVIAQKNSAKMSNNMPEMTRLQTAMSEAREDGDRLKAARVGEELMKFMKEKKCSPLKNMVVPMAQAPIFLSVFWGLRAMAELPVESMKTGGLWWFTDLTLADPYYILPLVTAATLAVTIEIGTDSTRAQAMGMMRYVLRAAPVIVFPFTLHFPAAILCYWASSNFISLVQVGILRIPKVQAFFKIEPLVKHTATDLSEQKGFVEGFRGAMANIKKMREMNSRYEADHIQFHRAGRAPVIKTYAYDPTSQTTAQQKSSAIMAKKR